MLLFYVKLSNLDKNNLIVVLSRTKKYLPSYYYHILRLTDKNISVKKSLPLVETTLFGSFLFFFHVLPFVKDPISETNYCFDTRNIHAEECFIYAWWHMLEKWHSSMASWLNASTRFKSMTWCGRRIERRKIFIAVVKHKVFLLEIYANEFTEIFCSRYVRFLGWCDNKFNLLYFRFRKEKNTLLMFFLGFFLIPRSFFRNNNTEKKEKLPGFRIQAAMLYFL